MPGFSFIRKKKFNECNITCRFFLCIRICFCVHKTLNVVLTVMYKATRWHTLKILRIERYWTRKIQPVHGEKKTKHEKYSLHTNEIFPTVNKKSSIVIGWKAIIFTCEIIINNFTSAIISFIQGRRKIDNWGGGSIHIILFVFTDWKNNWL